MEQQVCHSFRVAPECVDQSAHQTPDFDWKESKQVSYTVTANVGCFPLRFHYLFNIGYEKIMVKTIFGNSAAEKEHQILSQI